MDDTLPLGVRRLPESVQMIGLEKNFRDDTTSNTITSGRALLGQQQGNDLRAPVSARQRETSSIWDDIDDDGTISSLPYSQPLNSESIDKVFSTTLDQPELMPFG